VPDMANACPSLASSGREAVGVLYRRTVILVSIVRRAWMVSAGDNGIYTGSGLRGVIPYVQCRAAVFPS
jgi:hypothetical protein